MPTFGAYETVTELSRGAICSVWTARRAPSAAAGSEQQVGPAVFALKVCQPDIDIAGIEQAQRAVEVFLEQVDAQRRLAGLPNPAWAPIHEAGRVDAGGAGAYYVTDVVARGSLERLVMSRMRPAPRLLYAVVSGVLAGIRQARDFLRRPHGNIHAGNVLVMGEAPGVRVVLTDPAAESQLRGHTDAAGDLRALGELLYLLVTHQEYHERSGWPIADSGEWKRVAGGERWRALCNRLLDPNPGSPPTVEEIEQTLLNLSAQSGKGRGKLLVGAAAALVLAGGGIAAVLLTRRPPAPVVVDPAVTPANWATLVDEYDGWFAAFAADAARLDEGRVRAVGERVPEFKGWLAALRGGLAKDDPWEIAGVAKSTSLPELKKQPPPSVAGSDAAKATNDLLSLITGIRAAISTGEWSLAKEAAKVATAWRGRGWEAPAGQVDGALGRVRPDASLVSQASALAAVLDKAAEIERLRAGAEAAVARIDAEAAKVGGDKVLASFRGWADAYPGRLGADAEGAAALDTLAARVRKMSDAATVVAQFLDAPARANVCFDELAKSEFYAKFVASDSGPEAFEDWANEAKKQRYANPSPAEDPRAGKDLVEPAGRLAQELERLKKHAISPPAESVVKLDALGAELGAAGSAGADVGAKVAEVRRRAEEIKGLAWDCRTRQRIEVIRYDVVLQQLDEVAREWQALSDDKEIDVEAELARLRTLDSPVRDSEAVRAWWVERRDAVFREGEKDSRLSRARDLKLRLEGLDAEVKRWAAPADAVGRGGVWLRNVERAAALQRDAMIGAFLRSRLGNGAWARADQAAVADQYASWTASLDGVVPSMLVAERLMNAGYGLDEAQGDGKTVEVLAGAAAAPGMEQVREALSPVLLRVEALREVARATTPAQVVPLVSLDASNRPELTLAAWRRLGELNGGTWPATGADLDREAQEFPAMLRAVVNHEAVAARRDGLTSEIAGERQARWESFLKRAASAEDVERAMDPERTIRALEVDPAKATDPLVRYRMAAYGLKKAVGVPGVTDEQVKAAVEAFAGGVPGDLAGDPRVAPLLTGVRAAVSDTEEGPAPVDPKTLGPGSLPGGGWTAEQAEVAGRSILRFSRDRVRRLEFVRIDPGPGVPAAVYLGTDEVSLGQFAQIIDLAGPSGWQAIQTLMPTAEDQPAAPRAWRWIAGRGNDVGRIGPAGDWIQPSRPSVGEGDNRMPAYHQDFLRTGGEGKVMKVEMAPRAASPMQFVSPGAAVYAASLVGCRLPSPAEWKLAAAGGAPAEGTPNLRDQAWKKQYDYIKATRGRMRAFQDQFLWPDAGAFRVDGVGDGENAAMPADAADDGWVWFAPAVEGATGFAHLRGNVAEYVVNGPAEAPAPADPRAVSDFVNRRSRDIGVIGGSALSPPELRMEDPLPVLETEAAGGWSDVGFRLAFSATGTAAPRQPRAEVVASLLSAPGADLFLLKK